MFLARLFFVLYIRKYGGKSMHIRQLQLENFHGFASQEYHFPERFTVLIGENGTGKTAILDGVAVAMGAFIRGVLGSDQKGRTIREDEVYLKMYQNEGNGSLHYESQYPSAVYAEAYFGQQLINWKRSVDREKGSTTRIHAKEMIHYAEELSEFVRAGKEVNLPVISYFGTGRVWARKRDKTLNPWKVGSRLNGYLDCLDILSSEKLFISWLEHMTYIHLQEGKEPVELQAVKRAIEMMLERVLRDEQDIEIEYNVKRQAVVLKTNERVLPFELLSDGYRNIIGMVADIAFRMAVLNSHLGAMVISETEGIVLIDEIDLHLHPKWQKGIVADLKRTFPKVQFITTTHSPFVIQSCEAQEVINLNDQDSNDVDFKGWSLEEIIHDEMDVEGSRSLEYDDLMRMFNLAIEREDAVTAKDTYEKLKGILHPSSELRTILQIDLDSVSDDFKGFD